MPVTLSIVTNERDHQLLLGYKKRGLGEGLWNGFGGKVKEGEEIKKAAARELKEEAGIHSNDMELRAKLYFSFDLDAELTEGFVFHVKSYEGQPYETEEMRPQWFSFSKIPYEKMWTDDVLWLPLFLKGNSFIAYFHFDAEQSLNHGWLRTLPTETLQLSTTEGLNYSKFLSVVSQKCKSSKIGESESKILFTSCL